MPVDPSLPPVSSQPAAGAGVGMGGDAAETSVSPYWWSARALPLWHAAMDSDTIHRADEHRGQRGRRDQHQPLS